ncbi:MAG: hypothetical protein HOD17_07045 [Desulfobacteraceae bacterium]|jgi:hypothetical protein|nr:hypothetical protein [Desulfobacteraceae bacterium]
MRQKYIIFKDDKKKILTLKEYAELDKGLFTLMCEENYEAKNIMEKISEGRKELISALRTNNIFPPQPNMVKIINSVISLYNTKDKDSEEVILDTLEDLKMNKDNLIVDERDESVEIDELLDEKVDDDYVDQ